MNLEWRFSWWLKSATIHKMRDNQMNWENIWNFDIKKIRPKGKKLIIFFKINKNGIIPRKIKKNGIPFHFPQLRSWTRKASEWKKYSKIWKIKSSRDFNWPRRKKDGKLIFAEFSIKMSCVRVYFFSNSKLVITFVSLCLFWLDDYYWNGYLKIEIGWEHKHNAQLHCFNSERKNCQPPPPRSFSFLNAFQSVHWSDNLTLTIRM